MLLVIEPQSPESVNSCQFLSLRQFNTKDAKHVIFILVCLCQMIYCNHLHVFIWNLFQNVYLRREQPMIKPLNIVAPLIHNQGNFYKKHSLEYKTLIWNFVKKNTNKSTVSKRVISYI